jgi:hypothetical protein
MIREVKPLAEITQDALQVLCREIGVVNTVRFVGQFTTGYGNYTEEREQLFANMTLDDIASQLKQDQATKSSGVKGTD